MADAHETHEPQYPYTFNPKALLKLTEFGQGVLWAHHWGLNEKTARSMGFTALESEQPAHLTAPEAEPSAQQTEFHSPHLVPDPPIDFSHTLPENPKSIFRCKVVVFL